MPFCVFPLRKGQNIVLICFAGSKLKIDYACTVPLSVSTVRWFGLCKHGPISCFLIISGVSHPWLWWQWQQFLRLCWAIPVASPRHQRCSYMLCWLVCVSVRQMKSSRPCVSRRSPSSFPRSFLASHWNTATALGFEPAGHRRRCLAVGAAFAPQTAVPYFLQGKGGRPYGGILWSRFSPWVPVGPCWPRSKFRHILLGVCYFWQLECFKFWTRTDKIKLSFIWRWVSSFFGRSLLN